jgi:hypothetical protein
LRPGEVVECAAQCGVFVLARSLFMAQLRLVCLLCVVELALEALAFHLVHEILDVSCELFLPGSVRVDVLERSGVVFLEVLELGLEARDFLFCHM